MLARKFRAIWPLLDERTRRIMAANEAIALGYGGVSVVHRACGLSRKAIGKGIREIEEGDCPVEDHIRRAGGGRKSITVSDPRLLDALDQMIDSETRGDPESPLRWICKSTRAIALQLGQQQHPISHMKVAQILHEQNYSLQSNRKTEEGSDHPDRDAQFRHINACVKKSLARGCRSFRWTPRRKNSSATTIMRGSNGFPPNNPSQSAGMTSRVPKFLAPFPMAFTTSDAMPALSTSAPTMTRGLLRWPPFGDGGALKADSCIPRRSEILITADGGGSNGSRLRLWKLELQKLADETGLALSICHFPPGTSKWNKIEHRLFSFISSNWRGEPLRDYETIVNLIAKTTTAKGLKVTCRLDRRKYPTGRKVTNQEMKQVNVERNKFHGEWNYVIRPNSQGKLIPLFIYAALAPFSNTLPPMLSLPQWPANFGRRSLLRCVSFPKQQVFPANQPGQSARLTTKMTWRNLLS